MSGANINGSDPGHFFGQQICERVGEGARSVVYCVRDRASGPIAAMKHVVVLE